MPLLVHGITEVDAEEASASSVRVGDEELGVVRERGLAAIVRAIDDPEVLPSRANLLAHTRVLEELARTATVLPMRFGTVAPDERTLVADFLVPQHDQLVATLDRLRGHVELRLRGRYDEDALLRELVAADPGIARGRGRGGVDAQLALGERIVATIAARRERDLQQVVEVLEPHVAGIVPGGLGDPLDALSLSLLVPSERGEAFDADLDELGRRLAPALSLELVGPVPPLSFTAVEEVRA